MDGPQVQVVSKETLRALHPNHPERRHGGTENEALAAARRTLPR